PAAAMPGAPAAKPGGAQVFAAQAEAEPQRAPVAPGKVTAPAVATSEPGSGSGSSGFAAPAKPREPAMAEPAAADVSAQAQPLYKDNCLACHGDQLQGNVGPSLSKVGGRKSKAQLVEQIREGSSDMPGFKETLSEEEVETLAAWLTVKK
ncbi:c-type cytochrome, partial [Paenibacillus validus]